MSIIQSCNFVASEVSKGLDKGLQDLSTKGVENSSLMDEVFLNYIFHTRLTRNAEKLGNLLVSLENLTYFCRKSQRNKKVYNESQINLFELYFFQSLQILKPSDNPHYRLAVKGNQKELDENATNVFMSGVKPFSEFKPKKKTPLPKPEFNLKKELERVLSKAKREMTLESLNQSQYYNKIVNLLEGSTVSLVESLDTETERSN